MVVIIAALLIGISLGLLGSGGSILTVPALVYLVGQSPKQAITSALLIVVIISLFATLMNWRGRRISWVMVAWFGLPGIVGTYLGGTLASQVDGQVQLAVFALLMLMAVRSMWRRATLHVAAKSASAWLLIAQGIGIGLATGFVGVGGGFLIVPALVALAGLGFTQAVATSLVIIVINGTVGVCKYLQLDQLHGIHLNWQVIGWFSLLGIIGSLAGQWLAVRLPRHHLQRGFAMFLVVMSGFILFQTLSPWGAK